MILPDLNLLIHAHNSDSPRHPVARRWWDGALSGEEPVGLAWVALLGFIRITTHRGILARPWPVDEALARMQSWLDQPPVALLHPTVRHAELLAGLLRAVGTAGNLTTDAHLATLAIEHDATLCSTDADFARFSGLRWRNPLD